MRGWQRYVHTIPTRGYKFVAPSTLWTTDAERQITSDPEPAMNDGADQPITIAVLPFVNASGDFGTEHFSDGISEDILNALRMRTAPFASRRRYIKLCVRGGTVDVRTIAERLRVAFVLDGSVRRTVESAYRITAQLIDVEDRLSTVESPVRSRSRHLRSTGRNCESGCDRDTRGPREKRRQSVAFCCGQLTLNRRMPRAISTRMKPF